MASAAILSGALIAGMVAAFNPCGFALLPAYLAYFVGADPNKTNTNRATNIFRALIVGLTMTVAFLLLFGLFGVVASNLLSSSSIQDKLQWATFILGVLMVPLGIWMIAGKEINLRLPRLQKGGRNNDLGSIFLFGLSFAIVSLGCTAPVFFATVVGSFSSNGWFEGVQVFIAYGLGMSLIVLFLTLATGMARIEIAILMRKVLPHIGKLSGAFLILTGVFLGFYGWWEIQVLRGNLSTNWIVETSATLQNTISNWVADQGAGRLAIAIGLLLAGIVIWAGTWVAEDTQENEEAERRQLLVWRYGLLGVLGVTWLVLEITRYKWSLIALPIYHTLVDLPLRIWGWVSDPLRWSVPFEVLLAAFIIMIVILRMRQKRKARGIPTKETVSESVGA